MEDFEMTVEEAHMVAEWDRQEAAAKARADRNFWVGLGFMMIGVIAIFVLVGIGLNIF